MTRAEKHAAEERRRKGLMNSLRLRMAAALEHVGQLQSGEGGDIRWADRTVRDAVNLKLVEIMAAADRAKDSATTNNTLLGVVVLPTRIESKQDWEKLASRVNSGEVIDAEITPAQLEAVGEDEEAEDDGADS